MLFRHIYDICSRSSTILAINPVCVSAQIVLANPSPTVIEKLYASNFARVIGEDKIFPSVADAIITLAPRAQEP